LIYTRFFQNKKALTVFSRSGLPMKKSSEGGTLHVTLTLEKDTARRFGRCYQLRWKANQDPSIVFKITILAVLSVVGVLQYSLLPLSLPKSLS
jgi:hypothetical protein